MWLKRHSICVQRFNHLHPESGRCPCAAAARRPRAATARGPRVRRSYRPPAPPPCGPLRRRLTDVPPPPGGPPSTRPGYIPAPSTRTPVAALPRTTLPRRLAQPPATLPRRLSLGFRRGHSPRLQRATGGRFSTDSARADGSVHGFLPQNIFLRCSDVAWDLLIYWIF
jgi:hypothetical protein